MRGVVEAESTSHFMETGARRRLVLSMLLGVDLVALVAAALIATHVRFNTLAAAAAFENVAVRVSYYQLSWIAVAISMLFLWREGLYDLERLTWGTGEFSRVAQALALGVLAFILATYALHIPGLSRAWIVLAFVLSFMFVSAGRLLVRLALRSLRRRGLLLRRTLIVGSNDEAAHIVGLLRRSRETGLVPIGCLASSHGPSQSRLLW